MAASVAGVLAGWWLGESVGFPPPYAGMGLAMVVGVALGLATSGPGALWRALGSLVVMGALIGGFLGGYRLSKEVMNDCVHRGEEVRAALAEYRRDHGRFPQKLSQLPRGSTCGDRLMRGTILHYQHQNGEGYAMRFGDSLSMHDATHEAPFFAHK